MTRAELVHREVYLGVAITVEGHEDDGVEQFAAHVPVPGHGYIGHYFDTAALALSAARTLIDKRALPPTERHSMNSTELTYVVVVSVIERAEFQGRVIGGPASARTYATIGAAILEALNHLPSEVDGVGIQAFSVGDDMPQAGVSHEASA